MKYIQKNVELDKNISFCEPEIQAIKGFIDKVKSIDAVDAVWINSIKSKIQATFSTTVEALESEIIIVPGMDSSLELNAALASAKKAFSVEIKVIAESCKEEDLAIPNGHNNFNLNIHFTINDCQQPDFINWSQLPYSYILYDKTGKYESILDGLSPKTHPSPQFVLPCNIEKLSQTYQRTNNKN